MFVTYAIQATLLIFTLVSTEKKSDNEGGIPVCSPQYDVLNSQTFDEYPSGCTVIQGNVDLENSDLMEKQLSEKLSTVVTIEGYLWIANTWLQSLSLFSNLRNVTGSKSAEAALFVSGNSRLKSLGLPNLTDIGVVDTWSLYIDNKGLCISMAEVENFLQMKFAYFRQIPLCEQDTTYCYGEKSTNIPEGCRIFNGDVNIETTHGENAANIKRITLITTVIGNIRVNNIDFENLTLKVEHIYNDRAGEYSSITVISNGKLTSFQTPNLKKISNRNSAVDVNIVGNPVLKLSSESCNRWNNLTSVSTKNNAKECDRQTATSSASSANFLMTTLLMLITFRKLVIKSY